MPKPFTDQEKEFLHQRLLEQGQRLFSIYGLKKTSIEELARSAGISKGAFYLFFDSKETLFMEVVERSEARLRQEILAVIDQPAPTPRLRLVNLFKKSFTIFEELPLLHFFTGSDYDLLFRRLPPEKLQSHLANDQQFFINLVEKCRQTGIPISAPPDQIVELLFPLVASVLQSKDLGAAGLDSSLDVLFELIAAYCLGEIQLQSLPTPPNSSKGAL